MCQGQGGRVESSASDEYKAVPASPKHDEQGDVSLFSLTWNRRLLDEICEQGRTSIPTMLGMLLYKIPWILSLRFLGRLGSPHELAAAALATTLCNVTGMSLSVGLSSAMTTLTGQARGDLLASTDNAGPDAEREALMDGLESDCNSDDDSTDHRAKSSRVAILPLMYLYRGMFVQLVFVVPVGIWWLYGIKPTLLLLGQGDALSTMTEQYLRILTPGLWSYSMNWTLTSWLQAMEMADVPAYAAAIGLVMHVPFNLLFIYGVGWGYLGCAAATVAFQLMQPLLMLYYLFGTNHGRSRVLLNTGAAALGKPDLSGWNEVRPAVSSVSGIAQYLKLALPGIVIISEWWASEVSIFLSGRLAPYPDLALDGMTIYQSINTFCFMFPVGCSAAASVRVGRFLGENKPRQAAFSANVGVFCAAILSVVMGGILFFTPHSTFPSFFSPNDEVIKEASKTIPLLSTYVFADGVQNALNGIIKGCGRQCITMPIVVIAYWLVGVPVAYYVTFVRNDGYMCSDDAFCGVVGLVSGMTLGTWIHFLLLAVVVYCTTHWQDEAERAKERLRVDKGVYTTTATPAGDDEVKGCEMMSI